MVPQVKIFIILLLLFNFSISSRADNLKDDAELTSIIGDQVKIEMMKGGRKLLIGVLLDYQEPGANPGHEPHKGTGGGRGGSTP